jgi:hypothetical protein
MKPIIISTISMGVILLTIATWSTNYFLSDVSMPLWLCYLCTETFAVVMIYTWYKMNKTERLGR